MVERGEERREDRRDPSSRMLDQSDLLDKIKLVLIINTLVPHDNVL